VSELELNLGRLSAATLDAFVDAAIGVRATALRLQGCLLPSTYLPALTQLLRDDEALQHLTLGAAAGAPLFAAHDQEEPFDVDADDDDDDDFADFCAALKASKLRSLSIHGTYIWDTLRATSALLAALASHPTLRELNLQRNEADTPLTYATRRAAGELLSDFIASDPPMLETLLVDREDLGNVGMRAVQDACARSRHAADVFGFLHGRPMLFC
jgi:hypothetical protein